VFEKYSWRGNLQRDEINIVHSNFPPLKEPPHDKPLERRPVLHGKPLQNPSTTDNTKGTIEAGYLR
jgi:hypothetical protein